MITFMNVSSRLKMAMAACGMKKVELARRCSVSPPTITYWLNGDTTEIKGSNLLKAATALNVSPRWLETGAGEMSAPRHLSMEQIEILAIMDELTEQNQNALMLMARSLRSSQVTSPASATNPFRVGVEN